MGMPIVKSPLGGRAFEYEYGQTEFTEMLSFCLMQNIDALADAGFQFDTEGSGELPQPFEVLINQMRDAKIVPIPMMKNAGIFPMHLWDQQTLAIQQQTQIIERLKVRLQEKYDQIPAKVKEPGYFQQLINKLLDSLAEEFFWAAVKLLFKGSLFSSAIFGVAVIGVLVVKSLVNKLFDAIGDLTTMAAENQEIAAVDNEEAQRWELFDLRENVLTRHQRDINNMLIEIMTLEKQAKEQMIEPSENTSQDFKELVEAIQNLNLGGDVDLAELVQAVKDLQYNGQEFVFKDGSSYVLHGKTLSGTA